MAKLTNAQMDILGERATDILQEKHKEKYDAVLNSSEFKEFEDTYYDDVIQELVRLSGHINDIKAKEKDLEALQESYKQMTRNLSTALNIKNISSYYYEPREIAEPDKLKEKYLELKKKEKFSYADFDYAKTLRKVKADILLSSIGDPAQLVNELVTKHE